MKRARLILLLLTLLVVILLAWLVSSESGLRWAYQQAQPFLPEQLHAQHISGKLIGPITLDGIEYQQDGMQIKTGEIIFDWQPTSLFLAQLDISRLYIQSLDIVLTDTENPEPASGQKPALVLPEIRLPIRIALAEAEIDGLNVHQGEQTFSLQKVRLDTSTQLNKIHVAELSVAAESFTISINGDVKPNSNYSHELTIDWQAKLPSGKALSGHGRLSGDIAATQLQQELSGALALTLDAKLKNLLAELSWQTDIDVSQFDSQQLDPGLPALSGKLKLNAKGDLNTASVSGNLNGTAADIGALTASFDLQRAADNTIQIERLELHTPETQTQLNVSGHLLPEESTGTVNLALNWKNLRWPMQDTAYFNSASGSGTITGTLEQYRIQLASDSPWRDLLPSTWQAEATGNTQGLEIQSLQVRALNGEASAKGQVSWSPALSWNAEVSASNIDPSVLWPAWPGQLNAKLTSQGRTQKGRLIATANISQLDGTLRSFPVSLRSQLELHDTTVNIREFDFHSGDSRFTLQGEYADTLSLNWNITSDNLGELYPQARGQLHAQGLVKGQRDTPEVEASFNGKALKLADYAIESIEGSLAVDLFKWQQIKINLTATTLDLNSVALQTLVINTDAESMRLTTTSRLTNSVIELKGEVYDNGWRGHIERAELQSTLYDNWTLMKPVALDINQKTFSADKLCWHNTKEADLCLQLVQQNTAWHSSIIAHQLPLLLFSPWLPADLIFDGVANVQAELLYQVPDQLLGQVDITLPAGAVSYPLLEGERENWQYRSGKLEITASEKEFKVNSDFAMNNGDQFNAWLILPGAKLLALNSKTQTLTASAQLNVHDLGLIEALIPEIQDLSGEVGLNISLTGTLAQPRLKGQAQLVKGTLRIPRMGLSIDQINLQARSDGFDKMVFSLAAHSGDGTLSLTGQTRIDSPAGWPTEINIKGEDFEISSIPEARVRISPDLNIKIQQHKIDITGSVHVPYAKLQPKDITTAAHVSDDAVIIGGEQNTDKKWAVHTRVRVTLGDRVSFFGYGFEGRFLGNLLIEDEPGQLTRATGEISIPEGRYRAYGQRLDVEHGRILFTGGPLTNPGLDLSAVRRVNNVTAGLRVKGSLNHPVLELFSVPSMGETDALSYLLLGRPLENASSEEGAMMAKATLALGLSGGDSLVRQLGDRFGFDEMRVESSENSDQASLVVGRYLSPKVYVSYGVGLIEAFNTFTVRYQISENWQIKAESGEAQGADILYTFER